MPANLNGKWDLVENENFEGYMIAAGFNFVTRKIAGLLKQQKVIEQDGDSFTIKTLTTFINHSSSFKIGVEFEEENKGLDNKKYLMVVNWEGDKLVCVQKGHKEERGWTHWIDEDMLHLEMKCGDQIWKQTFKRAS